VIVVDLGEEHVEMIDFAGKSRRLGIKKKKKWG
jgi:hypothetical protein